MTEDHLDLETIERFGFREISRQQTFDVGWHLFLCADCRRLLGVAGPEAFALFERLFGKHGLSIVPGAYTEITLRVAERLQDREAEIASQRADAPRLWRELADHPPARRLWMVEALPRFQTFALAEHLLGLCRAGWNDHPARSEDFAELALAIVYRLDSRTYGAALLNDVKAEAWSAIANCRRLRSDLRSVSEAFELAERFRAHGSGDPIEEAQILRLRASFLRDQRRFDEAALALDRVVEIHRQTGSPHQVGRALLARATLERERGELDRAIVLIQEAAGQIDFGREEDLLFLVRSNLALYLSEAGRLDEAQELLPEIRTLARSTGSRLDRLRFLWTEGLICRRAGRTALAEQALRGAMNGFQDLGESLDAALAGLDLALLLVEQKRPDDAARLAAELHKVFADHQVGREARLALSILRRTIDAPAANAAVGRELDDLLDRLRRRHRLIRRPTERPGEPIPTRPTPSGGV